MTETTEQAYRVSADELRQFVERIERLDQEKKDIAEQRKEVMAECKGRGYDTARINDVIKLRAMDPNDRAEQEAVLVLYTEALGL